MKTQLVLNFIDSAITDNIYSAFFKKGHKFTVTDARDFVRRAYESTKVNSNLQLADFARVGYDTISYVLTARYA